MKRDLIYLFLIVAAIAAAKVTAQTTPETPAEIRPQHIEAGRISAGVSGVICAVTFTAAIAATIRIR